MSVQPLDMAGLSALMNLPIQDQEDQERLVVITAEMAVRRKDALNLYRPMATQLEFHQSMASERVLRGGNRCLAPEQEIYDPIEGLSRRVDSIDGPFHVWAMNEAGERVIALAEPPFLKGIDDIYEITLADGRQLRTTLEHRMLTERGWLSVAAIARRQECEPVQLRSISDTCQSVSPAGDRHWSQIPANSMGHYWPDHHPCDAPLPAGAMDDPAFVLQLADAHERSLCCSLQDGQGRRSEYIHSYRLAARPSSQCAQLQTSAPAAAFESQSACRPYSPPYQTRQAAYRSDLPSGDRPRTTFAAHQSASRLASVDDDQCPDASGGKTQSQWCSQFACRSASLTARTHTASPLQRHQSWEFSCGGIYITSLRYLRTGEFWDLTVPGYENYLIHGIPQHNSGKTTSASAEFASAATGLPILGQNGLPITDKYPRRPLLLWCIGFDQRHIGGTLFRMLFQPGAFSIIRDETSGEWRAYMAWDEADRKREKEKRPAPAFIPARLIDPKGWAWENKAERVFSVCRLRDGTEIHAYSSQGEPKQGDPVDVIWIDEDVAYSRHLAEWQARLSDRKGRLFWSAFPKSSNNALITLSDRAEEQRDRPNPDVTETVLTFSANPHIDADEKRKRLEGWDENERRSRDLGEFLTDNVLMYPTFSVHLHGIPAKQAPREIDAIIAHDGVPMDWTNYLVLDPGHAHPAILMASVPPPELGDFVVLWGECYPSRVDAHELARQAVGVASGRYFEAFIIDGHAGRQTPMGFGRTVRQQYSEAFEKVGLVSRLSGSGFIAGSDNIESRTMLVREWLAIRADGTPKLRIIDEGTKILQKQMKLYKKRIFQQEVKDVPIPKDADLPISLEYLAAFGPYYRIPENTEQLGSPAFRAWKRFRQTQDRDSTIYLGAGKPPVSSNFVMN